MSTPGQRVSSNQFTHHLFHHRFRSRGVEQACRAPLNKALCSALRISARTLADVPARSFASCDSTFPLFDSWWLHVSSHKQVFPPHFSAEREPPTADLRIWKPCSTILFPLTFSPCGSSPHQTTVALSQVQNLLRQATDIMAHLHTHLLHHIRQADPTFRQNFRQLPPPPTYSINLPSPTSSCDSAPSRPPIRLPPPPSNNSDDTPSPTPTPQPATTRKRKQPPPPPLNQQADWDAWDGDADCRLVELKGNPRLRPNWVFVARRVGFSVEQCQARWKELKDLQHLQDKQLSSKPPQADPQQQEPSPPPTPTSPAGSPPPPSQPDFSPSPMTTPPTPPAKSPTADVLPLPAAERAPSENRHPEKSPNTPIGSYFM